MVGVGRDICRERACLPAARAGRIELLAAHACPPRSTSSRSPLHTPTQPHTGYPRLSVAPQLSRKPFRRQVRPRDGSAAAFFSTVRRARSPFFREVRARLGFTTSVTPVSTQLCMAITMDACGQIKTRPSALLAPRLALAPIQFLLLSKKNSSLHRGRRGGRGRRPAGPGPTPGGDGSPRRPSVVYRAGIDVPAVAGAVPARGRTRARPPR